MMRAVPGCAVLYPCDGVSTERLVVEMARYKGPGLHAHVSAEDPGHLRSRTNRSRSAGPRCCGRGNSDEAVVVGAGVTVFEALKAYDQLKAEGIGIRVIDAYSVQPIDATTLIEAARAAGGAIITVEDHYAAGGLGDAVSEAGRSRRLYGAPAGGPGNPAQRPARRAGRPLRHLRPSHRRRCS